MLNLMLKPWSTHIPFHLIYILVFFWSVSPGSNYLLKLLIKSQHHLKPLKLTHDLKHECELWEEFNKRKAHVTFIIIQFEVTAWGQHLNFIHSHHTCFILTVGVCVTLQYSINSHPVSSSTLQMLTELTGYHTLVGEAWVMLSKQVQFSPASDMMKYIRRTVFPCRENNTVLLN